MHNKAIDRTAYRRPAMADVYEVTKPFTCGMKGARHTSCLWRYVGRGRVRVVTPGRNLPRHGAANPVRGAGQTRRP